MRYVFLSILALAAAPLLAGELADPVRILDRDIPHAAPFFADVDGDGINDLLVGQYRDDPFTGARVRLFRNIGTAKAPKFDDGMFVTAGSVNAACDEFCHTGFGPQVVDFNGDGVSDLITGSRDCRLYVFAGRKGGGLNPAGQLSYFTDKEHFNSFRYNARLFAYDWDRDGDLDLLSARRGVVWLIPNEGNSKLPKYGEPIEVVRHNEKTYFRVPIVADWDRDGRADLIIGQGDGSVVWLRNTAPPGTQPQFDTSVQLVQPATTNHVTVDEAGTLNRPTSPTKNIRICVTDFNADGQLDLLVGDAWFSRRASSRNSPEQTQKRIEAYAVYRKVRSELRDLEEAAKEDTSEATNLMAKRAECAKAWRAAYPQDRHGSVWLFQRK